MFSKWLVDFRDRNEYVYFQTAPLGILFPQIFQSWSFTNRFHLSEQVDGDDWIHRGNSISLRTNALLSEHAACCIEFEVRRLREGHSRRGAGHIRGIQANFSRCGM